MSKSRTRFTSRSRKLPFMHEGLTATIDASQISNWRTHHGTTASGQKVNSMQSTSIGDSIILKSGQAMLSVSQADFEVMSVQYLTEIGFSITPPRSSKTR